MASMLQESTLLEYASRLGWKPEARGEKTWRAKIASDEGEVSIYLRLSEHWLIASVVPFLLTGGSRPLELSRWLLRMNRDMFQTKFGYDEDGDIVLSVELPTESVDFEEVRLAFSSLIHDTVRHRATLRASAATTEG
jgi:hypothetical protein